LQIDTIDAVIAQLRVRHQLKLLATDNVFVLAARYCDLRIWREPR
jgi:hypothetical protein